MQWEIAETPRRRGASNDNQAGSGLWAGEAAGAARPGAAPAGQAFAYWGQPEVPVPVQATLVTLQ
jgi:hypothetical protein